MPKISVDIKMLIELRMVDLLFTFSILFSTRDAIQEKVITQKTFR